MSFSYSGDPSNSPNDAVRFEIQDTVNTNFLLADEEISYAITQEAGTEPSTGYTMAQILSSAAHCFESLSRRFSLQADTQLGQLKATYAKTAANMAAAAVALRLRAQGMQGPYVGGISYSDKIGILSNPDWVRPAFTRDEFNNPWAGPEAGDILDQADLGPPLGT